MEPKSCGESSAPDAERERLKLGALGVQSVAVSPGAASLSEETRSSSIHILLLRYRSKLASDEERSDSHFRLRIAPRFPSQLAVALMAARPTLIGRCALLFSIFSAE